MKKILIISPHFPPSNLAGVHRSRLFALHLPAFGWEPVILTVHEKFYEEALDWNLHKLLPANLSIEKVQSYPITKPRLVGDLGLRAIFHLRKRALELIQERDIDFVLIPIPSFYCALIGPWLYKKTGVPYGIDYIDPWVHQFPGSEKFFSRHWFSTQLARFLEPIAVKKAALISGVAEGYYLPVLERNPHLRKQAIIGAMPYGGELADHQAIHTLQLPAPLFQKNGKFQLVYAGAMLPKAYGPLEAIFKAIATNRHYFDEVEFHFIGTGKTSSDPASFGIKTLAESFGLWQTVVFEYPKRLPYLEVLAHLEQADGIFILGSTEPHYTPSKTYQGVLSDKPLLAVLHKESTAVKVIESSGAGKVLAFDGGMGINHIFKNFLPIFLDYQQFARSFNPEQVNRQIFDAYSAYHVTGQLATLLDLSISKARKR